MKNLFLVCCILNFSMTPLIAQNPTEGQVWIIINYIKAASKADYEKWMTDIFFAPMKASQDPVLKKQFSTARWQKPVRQNDDKTWTYSIILDPAVPNADYDVEHFLSKTYGEAKSKTYMQQYESFMASAGQIHFFESNRAAETPSVKNEEEAIKKVCIAESQAFSDLDYAAYASYHVQSADDQLVYNNPNGTYGAKISWDTIGKTVKGWIQSGKKEDVSKVSGDNFTIVIHGDMAFAAYDARYQKVADGKITRLRENRTLLYNAGQWKILAVLVFIDYSSGK